MPDWRAWRRWLEENHARSRGVWLVFQKRHTGVRCVTYDESVEEALCFGWVDSQIRSIDGETYARKYTPRNPASRWSPSNIRRVEKLKLEGRMAKAGLDAVAKAKARSTWFSPKSKPKDVPVPAALRRALRLNPKAAENFRAMAPSHRDGFSAWVSAAKTEATQKRRVDEAMEKLERNEKLGLK